MLRQRIRGIEEDFGVLHMCGKAQSADLAKDCTEEPEQREPVGNLNSSRLGVSQSIWRGSEEAVVGIEALGGRLHCTVHSRQPTPMQSTPMQAMNWYAHSYVRYYLAWTSAHPFTRCLSAEADL